MLLKLIYLDSIHRSSIDKASFNYNDLVKLIKKTYNLDSFSIHYIDDEEDYVVVTSDDDFKVAIAVAESQQKSSLRLSITKTKAVVEQEQEQVNDFASVTLENDSVLAENESVESEFELIDGFESNDGEVSVGVEQRQSVSIFEDDIKEDQDESDDDFSIEDIYEDVVTLPKEHDEDVVADDVVADDEDVVADDEDVVADDEDVVADDVVEDDDVVAEPPKLPDIFQAIPQTVVKVVEEFVKAAEEEPKQEEEEEAIQEEEERDGDIRESIMNEVINDIGMSEAKKLYSTVESFLNANVELGNDIIQNIAEVLRKEAVVRELQRFFNSDVIRKIVVNVSDAIKNETSIWEKLAPCAIELLMLLTTLVQRCPDVLALLPSIIQLVSGKKLKKKAPEKNVVHRHIYCDGCIKKGLGATTFITGPRFKSAIVEDFDICQACEQEGLYRYSHGPFLKIDHPSQNPKAIICVLNDDFSTRTKTKQPSCKSKSKQSSCKSKQSSCKTKPLKMVKPLDVSLNEAETILKNIKRENGGGLCPKNHALELQQNPFERFACDVCEQSKNPIFGCRKCDWDACLDCLRKNTKLSGNSNNGETCPGNHPLRKVKNHWGNLICDVCDQGKGNPIMYSCRQCDFDICELCNGPQVVCPQQGHVLRQFEVSKSPFAVVRCDDCSISSTDDETTDIFFGCHEGTCNYDLCHTCAGEHKKSRKPCKTKSKKKSAKVQPADNDDGKKKKKSEDPKPSPRPQCKFVADVSVHDGSIMGPGVSFEKTWRVVNNGKVKFPEGTRIIQIGGDDLGFPTKGLLVDQIDCGHLHDITVKLMTPNSSGRYVSYFRLITKDNVRFGMRLWVDVVVDGTLTQELAANISEPFRKIGHELINRVKDEQKKHEEKTKNLVSSVSSQYEESSTKLDDDFTKYKDELQKVADMGFYDINKNIFLLKEFNGDVDKVVAALLSQD